MLQWSDILFKGNSKIKQLFTEVEVNNCFSICHKFKKKKSYFFLYTVKGLEFNT